MRVYVVSHEPCHDNSRPLGVYLSAQIAMSKHGTDEFEWEEPGRAKDIGKIVALRETCTGEYLYIWEVDSDGLHLECPTWSLVVVMGFVALIVGAYCGVLLGP